MARPRELPTIKQAYVIYNGDKTAFDRFMESMIREYLNHDQGEVPKDTPAGFGGKVEIPKKK